ncbi:MAG: RHS repeat-associated core domain-containing protein, partial [Anaerolineae bacterium]|nr:RHS repeat-associated core domain-containing protein [Anaerolineae bacterium]
MRGVASNTAAVLESRNYEPFGMGFGATGTSQTPYGFTGEPTDSNGLVYLRARYYSPALGVFASLDPLETPNRYSYVSGNPANRVDFTGMFDWFTLTTQHGDCIYCIAREGLQGPNTTNQQLFDFTNLILSNNSFPPLYWRPEGDLGVYAQATLNIPNTDIVFTGQSGIYKNTYLSCPCGNPGLIVTPPTSTPIPTQPPTVTPLPTVP